VRSIGRYLVPPKCPLYVAARALPLTRAWASPRVGIAGTGQCGHSNIQASATTTVPVARDQDGSDAAAFKCKRRYVDRPGRPPGARVLDRPGVGGRTLHPRAVSNPSRHCDSRGRPEGAKARGAD
jgi:hypothetical protein